MTPQPPPLDIVSVAIVLATGLFSPGLAAVVGPYAVILFGATLGASISTARRPQSTRLQALAYLLCVIGLAVLVTVPLAELVAAVSGQPPSIWFGPCAALIGYAGPQWVIAKLRGLVERRSGEPRP